MKQNKHQFMRAMFLIAVFFAGFLGVDASTPGLFTDSEMPKATAPDIYVTEGVGKYTVMTSSIVGSEVYYRVNSGEWIHYMLPIAFDEYGTYLFEAYATYPDRAPSDIVSRSFVVDEHTGENLVDPDANNSSVIFYDGFKYKINGSTVSLMRQNDKMSSGDLVIPSTITHNGVTYTVTEVESWACYDLYNLTSVQIPSTVTSVGLYAFNGCPKLRSIEVDPANANYCDRDGVLYNKNGTYLLSYPNARSPQYTIPDGVTMIYYSAFQEDVNLVSVTIPNSVTSIRTSAFSCCYSLESVALPNNLGNLDAGAFASCKGLKSVTLSTKYNKIPEWCFEGCTSLESIVVPANVRTIAYEAFKDCKALSSVTLNEGLKTIQDEVFSNCISIPEITIPSTVSSIGEAVFYRCTGLTVIHVNSANNYYCDVDGVLYNKNKTTLLTYPAANPRLSYDILPTTQVVNKRAFESCKALEHLTIPSGVTTTGEGAFSRCVSLKSIFIPNTLTSMGSSAFSYCSSLTDVTLEDGIKVLGSMAFESCSSLKHINLVESLTTIGDQAFRACTSLTELKIPDSVTSIGGWTFYMCKSLNSINIPPGITTIPSSLLRSCNSLKEVTIPAGVTSIGTYAFLDTPLGIVNCLAETPPTIADSNAFAYSTYNKATLCVPPSSVEDYKSAAIWSNFVTIKGIFAGDADGDGVLTVNDVTSLIDFFLNGNTGSCFSVNADSNGDGVVNISDVTDLIDLLLGQD